MCNDFLETIVLIRDQINFPMIINSAYRCSTHNTAVGGVNQSYHRRGRAIDVAIKDPDQRAQLTFLAIKYGLSVIVYPTFLHLDNRDDGPVLLYGRS